MGKSTKKNMGGSIKTINRTLGKLSTGISKPAKGQNFYHGPEKLRKIKMIKSGAPIINKKGQIVKEAAFAKTKPDAPVVRVDPNRKWFGNTRTMTQANLDKFRLEMEKKMSDPYQVLLRSNKLPLSLLSNASSTAVSRIHLLEVESFSDTFGAKSSRKRPKLSAFNVEELALKAGQDHCNFESVTPSPSSNVHTDAEQGPALSAADQEYEESFDLGALARDPIFKKGQSKRIWNELYKVIDSSDVIIHVLDARDPLGTQCKTVENFVKKQAAHKHLIYLLNKCDLIPPSVTSKWIGILSKDFPTLAFHASMNNPFGKGALINLLRQYGKLHPERKQISVGFIGYPNTGKSSIINALKKKKVCTVAPIPGQTKVWQYITLMKKIYLIDCPGVVPYSIKDTETDLVLKGAIRIENIKNPEEHIGAILSRVKTEYLKRTYELVSWTDTLDFMTQLAKKRGKLLKGGEPDIHIISKMILNDWIKGKLPYFIPPPSKSETVPDDSADKTQA